MKPRQFDMHYPNNMMGPLALREQMTKNVKKTDQFCTVKLKEKFIRGKDNQLYFGGSVFGNQLFKLETYASI